MRNGCARAKAIPRGPRSNRASSAATPRSADGAVSARRLELTAELLRTLLPEIERLGLATAAELAVDSLADRMLAEAIDRSAVIVAHHQVGAWSRVHGGGHTEDRA